MSKLSNNPFEKCDYESKWTGVIRKYQFCNSVTLFYIINVDCKVKPTLKSSVEIGSSANVK
jgi:hypothetical protein